MMAVMVFGVAGLSGAAEVMVELNTIAFLGAPGDGPPPVVNTAITVLREEMEKRMGAPLKPMQLGVRLVAIHYQAGAFPAEGFRISSKDNGVLLEAGDDCPESVGLSARLFDGLSVGDLGVVPNLPGFHVGLRL